MAVLLSSPEQQFCDANGEPYAGGTIMTYAMGTTAYKATWADIGGTVLNTQPVVLDAAGRCLLYGDGDYRLILHDAVGNLVFDQSASTVVSAAMQGVVSGSIANAQTLLGIDPTAAADIAAEATARTAADANLQNQITANNTSASNAVQAETARAEAAEAAEATARANGDTNLQNQINTITGGISTAAIRAGAVTVTGGGAFTLTFTPPFATGVAQIWVGYPPGVGEPTGGSPANPVSFPHITSHTTSGAVGILSDNNFTPISGSMNWWAIGW